MVGRYLLATQLACAFVIWYAATVAVFTYLAALMIQIPQHVLSRLAHTMCIITPSLILQYRSRMKVHLSISST